MTGFEVFATRAYYRPAGEMSFQQGVELVAKALARARELELGDILVNTTGLLGIDSPGVFDRYAMMTRWVQSAGKLLRIAIVARPSFIDHQRIGVLIAQNRGGSVEVFSDEPAALKWLEAWRVRATSARWPARGRACGY